MDICAFNLSIYHKKVKSLLLSNQALGTESAHQIIRISKGKLLENYNYLNKLSKRKEEKENSGRHDICPLWFNFLSYIVYKIVHKGGEEVERMILNLPFKVIVMQLLLKKIFLI